MKKVMPVLFLFTTCMFTLSLQTVNAQETTKTKKELKNTVHLNLTNIAFFGGRSFVIGYERLVNKHQSFTVNFGTTGFPSLHLIDSDSLDIKSAKDNSGFNVSVDYRFYLAKENKYNAPRGVYIGPYYSYNYFGNKNDWAVKSTSGSTGSVSSTLKLNVHTIGAELGYQFVLWDRLAIDVVTLGPGYALYNLKFSSNSNFNVTEEDKVKIKTKLEEALKDRFPGWDQVSTGEKEREFKTNGGTNIASFGYRFMIQIGFRF